MKIKELTIEAFTSFCKNSPLSNYMQTEEYARFMGENKYNYDYIGLLDENNVIRAASIILIKKISFNTKYGYAPRGFLINYYDENLMREFIAKLKEFYVKKNIAFIKINPEIVVSTIDPITFEKSINPNNNLKKDLEDYGFTKLKDNLYFESVEPRFNAYIDLKNTSNKNYSKSTRNKVNNSHKKGLYIERGTMDDLDTFAKLSDFHKDPEYYKKLYSIFKKKDKIDVILVKVDYEKYIKISQELYEKEENNNNLLNEILRRSHKQSVLNKKMNSDALLCTIKNDIIKSTEGLKNNNDVIVAAAITIKDGNRIHVLESVYDKAYSSYNANYFLYNKMIEEYKKAYSYLDLGGISGDFSKTNPYYGLNRFKLGFNASIYEYIGEYDLVINKSSYEYLKTSGKLNKEFTKE